MRSRSRSRSRSAVRTPLAKFLPLASTVMPFASPVGRLPAATPAKFTVSPLIVNVPAALSRLATTPLTSSSLMPFWNRSFSSMRVARNWLLAGSGRQLTSTWSPTAKPFMSRSATPSNTVSSSSCTVWPSTVTELRTWFMAVIGPCTQSLYWMLSATPVPSPWMRPRTRTTMPTRNWSRDLVASSMLTLALESSKRTPLTITLPKPLIVPIAVCVAATDTESSSPPQLAKHRHRGRDSKQLQTGIAHLALLIDLSTLSILLAGHGKSR